LPWAFPIGNTRQCANPWANPDHVKPELSTSVSLFLLPTQVRLILLLTGVSKVKCLSLGKMNLDFSIVLLKCHRVLGGSGRKTVLCTMSHSDNRRFTPVIPLTQRHPEKNTYILQIN